MNQQSILVVDDEEAIRNVFKQAFSKADYNVVIAENAEKALDIIKQSSIKVMFLDLKLSGMNGVELCKQIRKDQPIAIINAVTGYSSLFELSECREAGFDDYYTKPVSLKMLLDAAQDAFTKLDRWRKK